MATGRIGTTPVLTTRWSKAPAGGTTSLSGTDDNSVSLVYSVGYEAVYRNGVLLSRTNDYTATNGTSITLIDATIAGDIIEVFANATVPLTDTYSQTVADGKFINNTLTTTTGDIIYASAANTPARLGIGSTGQVLKVSGGVPSWGTDSAGALTLIQRTSFSNVAGTGTTFDNVFTSTYKTYEVVIEELYGASSTDDTEMQLLYSGSTQTSGYDGVGALLTNSSSTEYLAASNAASFKYNQRVGNSGTPTTARIIFNQVGNASENASWHYTGVCAFQSKAMVGGGKNSTARTYTGFLFKATGNVTGTIAVYGLAK